MSEPSTTDEVAAGTDAAAGGRIKRANTWVRDEQSRATRAVEDARHRLELVRPRSVFVDVAFRSYEHDTTAGGAVIAGALAFRIFLFLVPYIFVFVVGVGYAADAAKEDPGRLARDSGIGGLVAKAVSGAAKLSGFERATAFTVGAFALFFGARSLLKVLRLSYGMVWNVRPSKAKKTMVPTLVLIGLTTVGLVVASSLGTLRGDGVLLLILGYALVTLVPFGLWLFASWYLPRRARTWQELVPGAALFAVGIQTLHLITVFWIAHLLESKTDTYGAIGAALAILLWAYLLGRVITAAAVVNAAVWVRHRDDAHEHDGAVGKSPDEDDTDGTDRHAFGRAVRDDDDHQREGSP